MDGQREQCMPPHVHCFSINREPHADVSRGPPVDKVDDTDAHLLKTKPNSEGGFQGRPVPTRRQTPMHKAGARRNVAHIPKQPEQGETHSEKTQLG